MQEYFFGICSEEKKIFFFYNYNHLSQAWFLIESMEGSKIVDKLILFLSTFLVQSFHIFNDTLKMSKIQTNKN